MGDSPILEPIEEVMATSVFESYDSDHEEDVKGNPEEIIEGDEDSNEPSSFPRLKSHRDP